MRIPFHGKETGILEPISEIIVNISYCEFYQNLEKLKKKNIH
jgi:hypothetical protein